MTIPSDHAIDITGEVCPMTFVRTKLKLERMQSGEVLSVRLRGEEPLRNVPRAAEAIAAAVTACRTSVRSNRRANFPFAHRAASNRSSTTSRASYSALRYLRDGQRTNYRGESFSPLLTRHAQRVTRYTLPVSLISRGFRGRPHAGQPLQERHGRRRC